MMPKDAAIDGVKSSKSVSSDILANVVFRADEEIIGCNFGSNELGNV